MAKKPRNGQYAEQNKIAAKLDELALFEDFQNTVLPKLQKLVKENATPEKIYKEFSALVSARAITLALTEQDPARALAAITEVLNRGHGKPKERVEQTHKYSQLGDEELDNLLRSTMATVAEDDEETLQ